MPNMNTNISALLKDMNTYSCNTLKNMAALLPAIGQASI